MPQKNWFLTTLWNKSFRGVMVCDFDSATSACVRKVSSIAIRLTSSDGNIIFPYKESILGGFLWKLKNEIFALSHVRIRILFVFQNRNSRKPHMVIFYVVKKLYLLFRSCWVRAAWVWAAVTWLRRTISSMKRRYTSLLNRYKEYFEERGCGLVGVKFYTYPPPPPPSKVLGL